MGALVAAMVWFVLKADVGSLGSDLESRDTTEKRLCTEMRSV